MKPAIILALLAAPAVAAVVEHDPQPFRGWCFEPDDILRNPQASILPPVHPWQRQERSRYYETPPGRWRAGGGDVWGWESPAGGTVTDRGGAHQPRSPAFPVDDRAPAPIPLPAIGSGLLAAVLGAAVALWWRR